MKDASYQSFRIPSSVFIEGRGGKALFDLSSLDIEGVLKEANFDAAQHEAITKMWKDGLLKNLSESERESISDIKLELGLNSPQGDEVALIVRFDCKWVRIDEPRLTFEELNDNAFNI
jgi:hypothetical protein